MSKNGFDKKIREKMERAIYKKYKKEISSSYS